MPIANTDAVAFEAFKESGVITSDTFETWRKKTNGIVNALAGIKVDDVTPDQLSVGAPSWTSGGALSTANNGNSSFKAGAITGASLNVGSGPVTAGLITGTSLNFSSGGAINGAPTINAGTINGSSLNTSGSISAGGSISGTGLNVGSGAVTAGAISASSLNTSGSVTADAITATSLNINGSVTVSGTVTGVNPTTPNHLTTKSYVDTTINSVSSSNNRVIAVIQPVPGPSTNPQAYAGSTFFKNEKSKKLHVSIVLWNGDDINNIAVHVDSNLEVLKTKNANFDSSQNGINSPTCVAYNNFIGQGTSSAGAVTFSFIVPPNFFYRIIHQNREYKHIIYEI